MIKVNKDDLLEIQMDLDGISNLLLIMETAEVYSNEDKSICRALRNGIDFTRVKLEDLIQNAKEL